MFWLKDQYSGQEIKVSDCIWQIDLNYASNFNQQNLKQQLNKAFTLTWHGYGQCHYITDTDNTNAMQSQWIAFSVRIRTMRRTYFYYTLCMSSV